MGEMAALDQFIAPGLRLWMLIGLVSGVLLIMVVIVCCFMRIRIPRTKRQIELIAARRKMRKAAQGQGQSGIALVEQRDNGGHYNRGQTIVMNSLPASSRTIQQSKQTKDKNHHNDVLASRSIPV